MDTESMTKREQRRAIVKLAADHRRIGTPTGRRVAEILESALGSDADAVDVEQALRIASDQFHALARRIIREGR